MGKNNFTFYFSLRITFSYFTSPLFSKVLIWSLSNGPHPWEAKRGRPPPTPVAPMIVIPKRRTGSIEAFFGKFPIHLYYVYTTAHALFQISHVYQGIDIPLLCHRRRVYAASVYISCLFGYKPKKIVVSVGLQGISSLYITLETSNVFILCVYYCPFHY